MFDLLGRAPHRHVDRGLPGFGSRWERTNSGAGIGGAGFPYLVLLELAQSHATVSIHRIDLAAIGTPALLTTDPAANFLDLLDDFAARRTAGETVPQALDAVWQSLHPHHCEEVINLIIDHNLPSIVAAYQGRRLLRPAVEYLAKNETRLLRRRLQEPLFDILPFANNNLNRGSLELLFRVTLPCDVIQSLPGDEDAVTRDMLVTFGVPPERWARLGYRPSYFLRTLKCLIDYLFAHLGDTEFFASADVESRCPFYTVCGLPLRRNHPEV